MNLNDLKKFIPEKFRRHVRLMRSATASLKYGFPSQKLKIIGVTGTSGKSTTAMMLYHVLSQNGFKVGAITTIGAFIANKSIETGLHVTTPDPDELHKLFRYIVDKGGEYVVLEVSSHSLAQERLGRIKFDHSIVTNIKSDHIDWHKNWDEYALAKSQIIKKTKDGGTVVINREDKDGYEFIQNFIKENNLKRNVITYSNTEPTEIAESAAGISFTYSSEDFSLPVIGLYNMDNALAVMNLALEMGVDLKDISVAFKSFSGVKGRMEVVQLLPVTVIVNFAHNADALEKSLKSVQNLKSTHGKVICVFGSAGLRDVQKRYDMGEISARFADVTIITAEDPRTEKLEDINSQIIEGALRGSGVVQNRFKSHKEFENFRLDPADLNKRSVFSFDYDGVEGRYDAIEFAIKIAKKGDIVITEGKGHEQSLCFGTTEYPFTDQGAVGRALENLKKNA